jgi:predicted HTH domain antitoxin
MKTVTLTIPDELDLNERDISMMLAAQLFDLGKLSLGQAANLVGLKKEEFMLELAKFNVSVFGESLQDIENDLSHA